jgi:methyl-accepting chemotaxis protein
VCTACTPLLRRARDELYTAKALVRQVRNSSKTIAAALYESEQRIDELLQRIEQHPHAKEAQGHERRSHAAAAR